MRFGKQITGRKTTSTRRAHASGRLASTLRSFFFILLCLCITASSIPALGNSVEMYSYETSAEEWSEAEEQQFLLADRFGSDAKVETDDDGTPISVNGYPSTMVRAGFNNLGQKESFQTVVDFVEYPFWQPATQYDGNLAVMSLIMAGCANRAIGFQDVPPEDFDPSLNLVNFLTDAGFTDIRKDDYSKVPTMFTVSTAMGHRVMTHEGEEPFTLIAIGVCGEGYKNEWESNMTAGTGDIHEGFRNAAQLVIDRLTGYIATRNIQGRVKVWISGFSRAAAISNVTAGTLVNSGFLSKEDVYAYTFATPAAIRNPAKEGYENIFNIINPADLVPQLMPAEWGYGRYGTDLFLPVQEFVAYEGAIGSLDRNFTNKAAYNVEYNYSSRLTLRTRLLYSLLLDLMEDVENYTANFQPALIGIMHDKSLTSTLAILQSLMKNIELINDEDQINLDELIDYFLQVFSGIMLRSGYREADQNTGSSLIRFMMEHTPNAYLSAEWEIRQNRFSQNDRCCYVMAKGPVSLTLWFESDDTSTELFTIHPDGSISYAESWMADSETDFFYAERCRQTSVIGVPMDSDFRVTWTAEKSGTMECLQAMSYERAASTYPGSHFGPIAVSAGDTGVAFQSRGYESVALENHQPVDFDARALVDFLGIASLGFTWRFALTILLALLALLLFLPVCLILHAKSTQKRSLFLWPLLYLLWASVVEAEAAYWLFADQPWARLVWKIVTALCFVGLFLLLHRGKGKNLLHTFFPTILLAVLADVCISIHFITGVALFLLCHVTLICQFQRRVRLPRRKWIQWAVVSVLLDAVIIFAYARTHGAVGWAVVVYAPVLLLMAFSSGRQRGRVRVSAMLFLISDCLMGLHIVALTDPVFHAAYMLLFYAALLLLTISDVRTRLLRQGNQIPSSSPDCPGIME